MKIEVEVAIIIVELSFSNLACSSGVSGDVGKSINQSIVPIAVHFWIFASSKIKLTEE